MKEVASQHIALKVDVTGPENNTVCRRVRTSFLQGGAVKGLKKKRGKKKGKRERERDRERQRERQRQRQRQKKKK